MFQIDVMSRTPVYEQIIEQMERLLLNGILGSGSQMPSVRSLSVELSINPNTIQKAYTELIRRGLLYAVPGKGCYVSPEAMHLIARAKEEELADFGETIREMALAGIKKEVILSTVEEVYARVEKEKGHAKEQK